MLRDFCHWLADTPISMTIQNTLWVIPTLQTIHILGIGVIVASVVLLEFRLMGLAGRGQPLPRVAARLLPWVWAALVVQLLTGSVLVLGEPERSLINPAFQLKMASLIMLVLATAWFQRSLRRNPGKWESTAGHHGRAAVLGALSLALWLVVIVAGRWIAYLDTTQG